MPRQQRRSRPPPRNPRDWGQPRGLERQLPFLLQTHYQQSKIEKNMHWIGCAPATAAPHMEDAATAIMTAVLPLLPKRSFCRATQHSRFSVRATLCGQPMKATKNTMQPTPMNGNIESSLDSTRFDLLAFRYGIVVFCTRCAHQYRANQFRPNEQKHSFCCLRSSETRLFPIP